MVTNESNKIHFRQIKEIEKLPIEKELYFAVNQNLEEYNSYYLAQQRIGQDCDHLFFFDRIKFIDLNSMMNLLKYKNTLVYSREYNVKKSIGLIHQYDKFLNFDYKSKDKWIGVAYLSGDSVKKYSSIIYQRSWYNKLMPSESLNKLNDIVQLNTVAYESIVSL